MEKNFSLYLTKIGFFDENIAKEIIKPNNEINQKTFVDSSFHYLMNFLDNLNESQKKYMSYFLPNNYKQITTKLKERKLKSIFTQKILRQKLKLLKYFYFWKNINESNANLLNNNKRKTYEIISEKYNNNELINNQNFQVSQDSIILNDYLTKQKINKKKEMSEIKNILNPINIKEYNSKKGRGYNKIIHKYNMKYPYSYYCNQYPTYLYNKPFKPKKPNYEYIINNLYHSSMSKKGNRNKNKLLTSLEEKELENLKECTFKPRINKSCYKTLSKSDIKDKDKENKENILSIFERLYKDEQKNKLSKELRTIDREYNLGKTFSFAPRLNNKFKKMYKYKDHKNFVQRQREYMEKSDKKKEELRDEVDSKYELLCSFNPKITNEKGEYYKSKRKPESEKNQPTYPVFKRLYLDMKSRKEMKEQKELENINKFNEMANYLTADKKVSESEIIERLLDYNKDEIINKAKEKVEKEEGVTFQPDIGDNEYIQNVSGNFLERNEQLLLDRKNYREQESAKQIENLRTSGEFNNNNKKYTMEEREEIINNVIERLYESSKNKKNKEENKDDESSLRDISNNYEQENEDNEEGEVGEEGE